MRGRAAARNAHGQVVAFFHDVDHAVDSVDVEFHVGIQGHELRPQRRQVADAEASGCTPDEVAGAVLFLASPEAAFIVGTELVVGGGMIGL